MNVLAKLQAGSGICLRRTSTEGQDMGYPGKGPNQPERRGFSLISMQK